MPEDRFTTQSGREVLLKIYVEPGNLERTHHAMRSLKESMEWDENVSAESTTSIFS